MAQDVLVSLEALARAALAGVISFQEATAIEELANREGSHQAIPDSLMDALERMALWQMPAAKTFH